MEDTEKRLESEKGRACWRGEGRTCVPTRSQSQRLRVYDACTLSAGPSRHADPSMSPFFPDSFSNFGGTVPTVGSSILLIRYLKACYLKKRDNFFYFYQLFLFILSGGLPTVWHSDWKLYFFNGIVSPD